jgi:predicted N-acetyltransferase YhbS
MSLSRSSPTSSSPTSVQIRRATPADAEPCGRIAYEAFRGIAERHNFPPDFPSPEVATELLKMLFGHPQFYCVVAEVNGKIVGSNGLDQRSKIGGIGPITVDPGGQNSGMGRSLMEAVLSRARESTPAGVRLVQAAYHNRSLSLYTKLGFDTREPLSVMHGDLRPRSIPGFAVRPATEADVSACGELCVAIHGHDRSGDLRDGIQAGGAFVVERGGRIAGYTSGLGFFGHTVGITDEDVQALIASAASFVGPGILVPTRNGALLRWCLNHGLRIVFPATLMSMGLYHEPEGAYLPSILY